MYSVTYKRFSNADRGWDLEWKVYGNNIFHEMDDTQREDFKRDLEINLAVSISGVGRFRINIFNQRNEVSIVARYIVTDIPNWKDLGLPKILPDLIMLKRGLILFVGATGSGKSTSLAAMIDYRNSNLGVIAEVRPLRHREH